jgi:hypothetical protein
MIVFFPAVLFIAAAIAAYLRHGWIRIAATFAVLAATAWSLLLMADWQVATGWLIGPVLASLLVLRPPARNRLTFEEITRRAMTLAATGVASVFFASKFPIGENPTVLGAVPWLLAAVGAAWLISPIDEKERGQAEVLLIGAGSALLLLAAPGGLLTAAACGAMAIVAPLAARWPLPDRVDNGVRCLLLAAAAAVATLALLVATPPRPALQDLVISLDGPSLFGVALLLVAGALLGALGRAWIIVPGLLAVLATAPSLRWAALAALTVSSIGTQRRGERFAWLSLLLLVMSSLVALVSQPWSPRAQIAALAGSLLLVAVWVAAGGARSSAVALSGFTLLILQNTSAASPFLMTRFGWVASAGAVLLVARALLDRHAGQARNRLEEALICGLLLMAVAAHDTLGLGILASVLLLIDLVVSGSIPDRLPRRAVGFYSMPVVLLARSGWPPGVRFAGVTIAVIAALQTSLGSGLLAALLLLGLKFSPVLTPVAARGDDQPRTVRYWAAPALSLACGLAPALVLRMLRV